MDNITNHRIRLGVVVKRRTVPLEDTNQLWEVKQSPPSSSSKFVSPFHIAWERQFNITSSSGSYAKGGGLDAQRVTNWIGPTIEKSFSTTTTPSTESLQQSNDAFGNKYHEDEKHVHTLYLPCNLTLSYGTIANKNFVNENDLFVDVIHHQQPQQDDNDDDNDNEIQSKFATRWVRWIFTSNYQSPDDAYISFGCGENITPDENYYELPPNPY